MNNVINYLNSKFINKDKVVVAVSGGPDSMLLLSLLLDVRKNKDITIICAHINHGVRKESDKEKIFVEKFCKDNDIVFEYSKIHVDFKENFHNEARKLRYHFFEHVLHKHNTKYLLTAHHGDDLMETILMRLVRGSSVKGYAGFKKETQIRNYLILRPLIEVTKREINDYCRINKIKYVKDKSNFLDKYTRNRYRKYMLPFLKKEDSKVHQKFIKFSNSVDEMMNYIDKVAQLEYKKIVKKDSLNIEQFKKQESFIKRRILYFMLEEKCNDTLYDINDNHIEKLIELIESKKTNSSINLPNEIVASKNYGFFTIDKEKIYKDYFQELLPNTELPNGKTISIINKSKGNGNNICRLSFSDVKLPLYVRNKKTGDKISVKGMKGSKKISDIFIDEKVNKDERETWPVVVDSEGVIVWLPGLKKTNFDKSMNETCDIILKYQ
jgi:tRNA(Ile)-lysidine synthetase-like protein